MSRSSLPDTSSRARPENLAILLREPFRAMDEELPARLAERGHPEVRSAHGNVFQYLDDDGTRVGVLAERARVSKQAMAQLVAHLEAHGYLERVPDPADGGQLVRSTARGCEVFAIARELMADIDARIGKRLGEAKQRRLRELLEELAPRSDTVRHVNTVISLMQPGPRGRTVASTPNAGPAPEKETPMQLYGIRRRNAWPTPGDLEATAARSTEEGDKEGSGVRWIRSYVVSEDDGTLGTFWIYEADSPETIRGMPQRSGMPATRSRRSPTPSSCARIRPRWPAEAWT